MNTKIKKRLFWATLTLVLTACSEILPEQRFSNSKGHSATVQFNVSTDFEGEAFGTRAIDPNDADECTEKNYKVSDFWLLQYDADGKLVNADGKPAKQYITKEALATKDNKLDIQLPNNGSYKCVMIANTHDEHLFNSNNKKKYESLDMLKKFTKDVKSFEDTYNNKGKEELYMSYFTEVHNTTKKIVCKFKRNVAKLTVKLNNQRKSKMEVTGIQVCNVPNKMAYADQLYEEDKELTMADGASLIDMPMDEIQLIEKTRKTLIYYLPRNCQGKDEYIDQDKADDEQKNTASKRYTTSATYVKVFATDTETKAPYVYNFYIGENMQNDFNVKPNKHYTLPITIKDQGSVDDSRIEDDEEAEGTMGANCIMMDLNAKDKVYTIYPHKRINKFWHEIQDDPTRTITTDYKWVAEVIWQDTPGDVIEFVRSRTDKVERKGKRPLKIKLKRSISHPCNVLIGVRKKSGWTIKDGFLWSWHLWITPYNPNRTRGWRNGIYKYNVPYGSVFRYAPGVEGSKDNDLWVIGGDYYDKYIMDRNLGATTEYTPTPSDELVKSSGMLYQFGRKDPFLSVVEGPLYKQIFNPDFNYCKLGNKPTEVQVTCHMDRNKYRRSVRFPNYTHNGVYAEKDWLRDNPYTNNEWNNPFPNDADFEYKSFFDPCPEGWKIPQKGTWNVFNTKAVDYKVIEEQKGVKDFNKANGSFNKGYNLDVGNGVDTTYYPAGGCRWWYGKVQNVNEWGYYWSSSINANNLKRPFILAFTKDNLYALGMEEYRDVFGNIRCVQE